MSWRRGRKAFELMKIKSFMRETGILLLALLAAAFVSALMWIVCGILGNPKIILSISNISSMWGILFLFALPIGAVCGIPLYLVAKKFGLITWWMSMIGGFIIGGVVYYYFVYEARDGWVYGTFIMGLSSMFGGLTAWAVWRVFMHSQKKKD
jgi:hypothetical protein